MNKRILTLGATAAVVVTAGAAAAATGSTGGTASDYTATASTRLVDTRTAGGPVGAGKVLVVSLGSSVPAGATAVTVNLTVTDTTAGGYAVVYGDGSARPNPGSNVNFGTGQTVANQATVPVTDGKLDIANESTGNAQIIVDLEGYYTPSAPAYVPPTTTTQTLPGVASVNTGGSFNSRATEVGTVNLAAGSYLVTMSAKATPIVQSDPTVQVFPSIHLYNQPSNPAFTGDVLDVGNGALESGAYTAADGFYSNSGVVTLTQATTMYVYAFGYDSNDGEGTYELDGVTITATPVSVAAN